MKTLHVSSSLSRTGGGIFEIELSLANYLTKKGVGVQAMGLLDKGWTADATRWEGITAAVFETKGPRAFGYAPELSDAMMRSDADLAHLHYIWMYPSIAVSRWAAKTGRPYVVSPNGMLEPWALNNSAWKKKIAGFFYESRMLRGAACLQANTEKELGDIRAYGMKNPIAIIPNGIEIPEDRGQGTDVSEKRKILLFLGRLHPKKGLVNALRAWSEIRSQKSEIRGQEEWQFVIAGWDQNGHEAELKQLCKELGLAYSETPVSEFLNLTPDSCPPSPVTFVGPAFGATKDALLRRASAFILPSFSEGLPMSILEAWAYRLPVLMTNECNLPEGFAVNAAFRIGTDVEDIVEGMRLFLHSTVSDLHSVSANGRALVERQFTWPMVAAQMKEVYEWVLGGGAKPGCVEL